eukprot:400311-Pyramimonas_sp.AAC.1
MSTSISASTTQKTRILGSKSVALSMTRVVRVRAEEEEEETSKDEVNAQLLTLHIAYVRSTVHTSYVNLFLMWSQEEERVRISNHARRGGPMMRSGASERPTGSPNGSPRYLQEVPNNPKAALRTRAKVPQEPSKISGSE